MNRRSFLCGILAAGIAPAIVKAANIMPVFARRESGLLAPELSEQYVITSVTSEYSILTPTIVTGAALEVLEKQLRLATVVGSFARGDYRVGDVVTFAKGQKVVWS